MTEPTPEMIDAALNAWFKSPPSETDQGLERSMKATLIASERLRGAAQAPMDREKVAKIFAYIWHGDLGEWQGFLSKADAFLTYPVPSTTLGGVAREKEITRLATIEECAAVCDKHAKWAEDKIEDDPISSRSQIFAGISNTANDCAEMVRKLKLGTGSESATGLAQCDTPSPAREQSDGSSVPSTEHRCTCGGDPDQPASHHDISCPMAIPSTNLGSPATGTPSREPTGKYTITPAERGGAST